MLDATQNTRSQDRLNVDLVTLRRAATSDDGTMEWPDFYALVDVVRSLQGPATDPGGRQSVHCCG